MQITKKISSMLLVALTFLVPQLLQGQDVSKSGDKALREALHKLLSPASPLPQSAAVPSSPFGRPSDPSPVSTHEKFATFLAGKDFKSTLLLQNFRPDLPITFIPTLILSAGEVPLDSVTVPAHSSTTVDISAILKDHGYADTRGTIAVRFEFSSYGPGSAVVQMRDDKDHVYLNSYAQSPEEYWNGTTYDAVVWAPHEGTQGFIAITNSSDEAHAVRATFLVNGTSEPQAEMQIPSRQTRVIPIDDLLARSRKFGGGIHIEYSQEAGEKYTGAILVEGQLFNKKTGFAKNIHFMDKALPPTGTLRTHFLMLGRQPAEDNFPANIAFQSVAAVRNIDTVSVSVAPTVKFIQNGALQTARLPSRSLAPAETLLIDFREEQKAGHLPVDFNQGSLDLTPDTGRVSIVGELFNFSQDGGYVVGPSFSSYPNRSTSSIWRTDGTFQTTIMVENTAAENDRVTVNLYSGRGQYSKAFDVFAGKLLKINVRDLQQNGVPDDKGNLLLDTSGVMSLVASRSTHSKLSFDKIIHNTDQADYVGLPANACDFVSSIAMWLDTSSGVLPLPVMKTYYWTQSGPEDSSQSGSSSSNSSWAQISNSSGVDMVNFSPPDDGATHFVNINPPFPTEDVTFCDACSAGDVFVSGVNSIGLRLTSTFFKDPTSPTPGFCSYATKNCTSGTPTCNGGIGLLFSNGCPQFVHVIYVVVAGVCEISVGTPTTGGGVCN
jgi:hypothetical protein